MNSRILICPKDIQLITGKSYKRSRLYLEKIKQELRKEPHQMVTSTELSNYLGISLEEVQKVIF
jgi:hypothetical protein